MIMNMTVPLNNECVY